MATTEARMKQLTGAYADLPLSNMLVGEMAVPTDHVPVVRNGVNSWENLLTSESTGDIIALSETMTEQIESFEQLVIDKVGINDSTATLTQAYSGSKTQGLIDGVNTEIDLKANQTEVNLKANQSDLDVTNSRIDVINTSAGDYYIKCLQTDAGALLVVVSGATTGQINLADVSPKLDTYTPIVSDYVRLVSNGLTSELIDIRTGADGIINASAGASVRRQFGNVQGNSKNIFAGASFKRGYQLYTGDGITESPQATTGYTIDYIEIDTNTDYSLSASIATNIRLFYYDSSKNYIATAVLGTDAILNFETVKYIRFQCSLTVYDNNNIQFEIGSKTEYAPALTANDTWIRKQYSLNSENIINASYLKNNIGTVVKIAASDSSEYDKKDSLYICSGYSDETVINNVISQLVALGGGKIILKKGRYFLSSVNLSHHCIECAVGSTVIEIESEIANYNRNASTGQESYTGAQLYMTDTLYESLSPTETNVIFSCSGNSLDGGIVLKNFGIVFSHNQKPIIGLDMKNFNGMCRVDGVYINGYNKTYEPNVTVGQAPSVAVEGCIGLRTICNTSIGAVGTQFKNCIVKGCYEGFSVNSEHNVLDRCAAVYCVYSYTFDHYSTSAKQHPNLLLRCMDERNINLPKFYNSDSGQATIIIGMNIERKSANTPGGVLGDLAKETTPGQHCGEISYTIGGDSGIVNVDNRPFWEDGHGHGIKTQNMHHLQMCDTLTRLSYKPNFMQKLFDTTLGREVICVDESIPIWVDTLGNNVDN